MRVAERKLGFFFWLDTQKKKWVYTINPPFFQVAEPLLPPSKSLLRVQIKRLHVVFEFLWVTRPYLHDLTIYIPLFLQILGAKLDGAEICIISLSGTASQYIKVLFVLW